MYGFHPLTTVTRWCVPGVPDKERGLLESPARISERNSPSGQERVQLLLLCVVPHAKERPPRAAADGATT